MIKNNEISLVAEVLRKKYCTKIVFSTYVLYMQLLAGWFTRDDNYLVESIKLLSLFGDLVAKYKLPNKFSVFTFIGKMSQSYVFCHVEHPDYWYNKIRTTKEVLSVLKNMKVFGITRLSIADKG